MRQVTIDDVREAYRLFLNREPESEKVIEDKLKTIKTFAELRDSFVSSAEFQLYNPSLRGPIRRLYYKNVAEVEVDVPEPILERLIARTVRQWTKLGETEPYWSVLSTKKYQKDNLSDPVLKNFYDSGIEAAGLIETFLLRTKSTITRGSCFELGCGVGRVTRHLADRFKTVTAADISPGNLALCRSHLKDEGVTNVDTLLIRTPADLEQLAPFDFFYSVITLQHNTPPLQKLFLRSILKKINRGGGCLFQTPAMLEGYEFDAKDYLDTAEGVMDVHCLPQHVVLDEITRAGLQPLMVMLDSYTLRPGSYSYFAIKP